MKGIPLPVINFQLNKDFKNESLLFTLLPFSPTIVCSFQTLSDDWVQNMTAAIAPLQKKEQVTMLTGIEMFPDSLTVISSWLNASGL